jgi:hypothetical protein
MREWFHRPGRALNRLFARELLGAAIFARELPGPANFARELLGPAIIERCPSSVRAGGEPALKRRVSAPPPVLPEKSEGAADRFMIV